MGNLSLKGNFTLPFPKRLEVLLNQPWTSATSLKMDRWLNYLALEFEGVES